MSVKIESLYFTWLIESLESFARNGLVLCKQVEDGIGSCSRKFQFKKGNHEAVVARLHLIKEKWLQRLSACSGKEFQRNQLIDLYRGLSEKISLINTFSSQLFDHMKRCERELLKSGYEFSQKIQDLRVECLEDSILFISNSQRVLDHLSKTINEQRNLGEGQS